MKKFLDDVFCEHLIEKKLLDKALLLQIKKDKESVTIREKLLLEKYISFSTYTTILSLLRQNRDIIDNQKSIEFDQKFLSYAYSQNLVPKDDIEVCRKHALASPFTTRELLFATSTIDFELYSQIMSELGSEELENSAKEDAEQTIIDEESFYPEESKETIKFAPLSIVKDNSAETIIDISPPDFEDEDQPFSYSESPIKNDDSAETIIDQDFGSASEEILAENKDFHGFKAHSKKEELEATLDIEDSVSLKPKDDLFENVHPVSQVVSAQKIDSRLKKISSAITGSPTITEIPQRQTPQSDLITEKMATIAMDDLIQEVQKQVNLQTQQISQNVGKEINNYTKIYKILCAIVIFIFLFLLAFTGFIEYGRFRELTILREEKNKITEQKDSALRDSVQAMLKLQEITENHKSLQKELEKTQDIAQKNTILAKENTILAQEKANIKQIEQARFHIQMALCYLEIQEIEKAKENAKKSWDLASEDAEVNLGIAEYFMQQKEWKKSIKYLENVTKNSNIAWVAYTKLGDAYYKQGLSSQARENWEKAVQLNPSLHKIQEKLKWLPK